MLQPLAVDASTHHIIIMTRELLFGWNTQTHTTRHNTYAVTCPAGLYALACSGTHKPRARTNNIDANDDGTMNVLCTQCSSA